MNAAVETSRHENQRRRPHGLAHQRNASGESQVDSSRPLAVLIRVPNLDAPRPAPKAAGNASAQTEAAAETNSRTTTRAKNTTTATAAAPSPNTTSALMGWAWRMMILAAAIGLVILAYRIINGPANSPTLNEVPENGVIAGSNSAATSADDATSMPPAPLAPQASEIAAPSTLAPPKVEFETPPVHVEPIDVGQEDYADTGARADDRRPWATDVRMQQPPAGDGIRTANSDWNNGWGRDAAPREQPRPSEQNYRDYSSEYSNEYRESGNWNSTDERAPSFDYPETSPNSWRDEGRWESTPRNASPNYHGASNDLYAPASGASESAWNQPAHSAMRPQEPGVARLQGQIEQPPLRRENERNRPGIY